MFTPAASLRQRRFPQVRGVYGLPDVCLSLPCVIGAQGVEMVLESNLADKERQALLRSGELLADSARQLGLL